MTADTNSISSLRDAGGEVAGSTSTVVQVVKMVGGVQGMGMGLKYMYITEWHRGKSPGTNCILSGQSFLTTPGAKPSPGQHQTQYRSWCPYNANFSYIICLATNPGSEWAPKSGPF